MSELVERPSAVCLFVTSFLVNYYSLHANWALDELFIVETLCNDANVLTAEAIFMALLPALSLKL